MPEDNSGQSGDAPRTIPLVDPARDTEPLLELMLARAEAIEAYAQLEQSLAFLFFDLAEVTPEVGGIIFFQIVNTRARSAMLEKLLKLRHGSAHNPYWNSLQKIVRELDQARNEIIHWHLVQALGKFDGDRALTSFKLTPPNFWDRRAETPSRSASEIKDFTRKCRFASRSFNMFGMFLRGQLSDEPFATWRDIFQQPVTYPPPRTHPLSRFCSE